MKQRYALVFSIATALLGLNVRLCQAQVCTGSFTTTANTPQVQIPTANWATPSVPANTSVTLSMTSTSGNTTVTVSSTAGLSAGVAITGPNVSAGTTIATVVNATTLTLSPAPTGTGTTVPHVFLLPAYGVNPPPSALGTPATACSVCPATFSTPVCAGEWLTYYMCSGNLYTFSLCGSAALWNSTISITTTAGAAPSNFAPFSNDDGCGTPNGHAVITFTPQTSQAYRVRIFSNNPALTGSTTAGSTTLTVATTTGILVGSPVSGPGIPAGATVASITAPSTVVLSAAATATFANQPYSFACISNSALCGTLQVACNPFPPPPPNDNPAGAIALTAGTTCNPLFTSAAYGTLTTAGTPPLPSSAGCGTGAACSGATPSLSTGDVWYTAVVPASGRLTVEVDQVSAGNLAMAVYQAPGAGGPFSQLSCGCNVDIATGIPDPLVNINNPALAGQTLYIRVWPEGGFANNGTFNICAFEPIPPPNDQPCGAIAIPVATAACSPQTFSTQNATALTGVTLSPAAPNCGAPIAGGDVWFTVTIPSTGALTVNTGSGTLSNMALQAYQPGPCAGPLTEVAGACGDNQNTVSVTMTTTTGSITATMASTAGLNAGDGISGANVPVNTTIAAVVNATTLTLSQPATVTGTAAHTIGNLMPRITLTGSNGQVFYIRVWNQNLLPGTFQICAFQNNPPPNDNPCSPFGAAALAVQPGCLFGPFQTNDLATTTPPTISGQHAIAALPTCGGTPTNDVWFTAVVPANGVLQFDTDDGQMTNAAMAIYTATGSCAAGNLALTQIPGACFTAGSANGAGMPAGQVTGLAPGSVVYIRLWREGGSDGTFQICARTTVPPPGSCTYILRLFDSAGDGWNGSFVTVCVGASCTNYTVNGSNGTITIGANLGQIITMSYTAVGGFQNQISYQLLSNTGGLIYGSTNPPTAGSNTAFVVDALCNVPPAPPSDCVGARAVCDNQSFSGSPTNIGGVNDLTTANRGCLVSNERQGFWYRFQAQLAGQLAFTIAPAASNDYDFAVWGPFSGAVSCPPPSAPLRCSYAAGGGPTGLNSSSVDLTEGAGGDRFVRFINVLPGQWYLLYVDNFAQSGVNFTLTWSNTPNNLLDCTVVLPVEMLSLHAQPAADHVTLTWSTASEQGASHFVVERSAKGDQFEPIGQVTAAGNTTSTSDYRFIDQRPLNGTNFYRLRTVDMDGTYAHTDVVTAEFRRGNVPLQLFPNPAFESINASFVLEEEQAVRWRILDMSGRLVQESNVAGTAGTNQMEIPLGRIDGGSYLFELVGNGGEVLGNLRFVKQ